MENILLKFSNNLLDKIGDYATNTTSTNEVQERVKLKTLIDVQNIVKDVLQQSIDDIKCDNNGMSEIKQLRDEIVDLKVQCAKLKVLDGHCPYCYFDIGETSRDCDSIGCTKCKIDFWNKYKEQVKVSVEKC